MSKILISIIFLISFGFAIVYDSFTGTLEKDDAGLYLKRCNLGSYIYRLKDQEKSTTIKDLEKKYSKLKKPITISLVAAYEECNGKDCLIVDSVYWMTENESCHLVDYFNGIDKNVSK